MNFDSHYGAIALVGVYFRIFDFTYAVRGAPPGHPRMPWWLTAISGDDVPSKALAAAPLGSLTFEEASIPRVVLKTAIVLLPLWLYSLLSRWPWALTLGGAVGIWLLVGNLTIASMSNLRRDQPVLHRIGSALSASISSALWLLAFGAVIWLIRKLTNWSLLLTNYIPSTHWIPQLNGEQNTDVVAAAAWLMAGFSGFMKCWLWGSAGFRLAPGAAEPEVVPPGPSYFFFSRLCILLLVLTFLKEYTGLLYATHSHVGLPMILGLVFHHLPRL
jgi:hypothetical protein